MAIQKFIPSMRNSRYSHRAHPRPDPYRSWCNVNPIGPRACYDEGKRVAETLTYGFQRQDGVDVRVARIFNTFGPRSASYVRLIRP